MKKSINRNIFGAVFCVGLLAKYGIKNVCLSPGSRNTPLIIAFSRNRKIKKHVIVDERSSCFYALGLAKASAEPVAVVTTSGTAVAELYPAIIEAFYSKVPLVVCTADRPFYMVNTGANQTINQREIFSNHINGFVDIGLPSPTMVQVLR